MGNACMIDFSGDGGYGVAPSYCADDPEILNWAQKWADNRGEPVLFVHWSGRIVHRVEPEVS